ncbi:MAG: VWA domain-containing protein [bacterium]
MERRRTRLEILAQVTAHDYDLALRYGEVSQQKKQTIQIEDPERTLERLGGDLNDDRVLRYQKGMTLIEVAHRLEGSMRWGLRAAIASRERPGMFQIWHVLEDARCENRLGASLPGTRKNFREFVRPALEEAERLHALGELSLFFQVQWGLYLIGTGHEPGMRTTRPGGFKTDWFDPPIIDFLDELASTVKRAARAESPGDAYAAAEGIYAAIREHLPDELLSEALRELEIPEVPEEALQRAQEQDSNDAGEDTEELFSTDAREQDAVSEEEPIELTAEELAALGHWASPWFEHKGHSKEVHPSAVRSDEGTIFIPPEGKAEEYQAIVDNASSQIKVLAWKLMQIIQERRYARYSGSFRSGKLNTPKLWKQRLGKYRLFQRREDPDQLDISFTLLVDESGSMNRESKYLAAREATVFFAEVLDRVEVPFEVIGYSTESSEAAMAAALGHVPAFKYRHIRHSPLQHRIYKAFDEPFQNIKNRLVNIYPRFNNWDEEHLQFAYRRLIQQPEEKKVIIITSDGQPNGDASHLIETVHRLEKLGVRVVGVGVVDPFVEQIYPNYIVVQHLDQLAEELVAILRRELLKSGEEARTW